MIRTSKESCSTYLNSDVSADSRTELDVVRWLRFCRIKMHLTYFNTNMKLRLFRTNVISFTLLVKRRSYALKFSKVHFLYFVLPVIGNNVVLVPNGQFLDHTNDRGSTVIEYYNKPKFYVRYLDSLKCLNGGDISSIRVQTMGVIQIKKSVGEWEELRTYLTYITEPGLL